MRKTSSRKEKKLNCIRLICWIIIPASIISFLILDGLGIYPFSTERLIVIGVCIVVALVPFFNEITVKDFSIKKDKDSE